MINSAFKLSWRGLKKNLLFSSINILGLSVGLCCCVLITLYVIDEFKYDKFHVNSDRIYRLTLDIVDSETSQNYTTGNSVLSIGVAMKQTIPEVENFVRVTMDYQPYIFKNGNDFSYVTPLYADSTFFKIFSFPLILGDYQKVLSQPNSVVLTEGMAMKYFSTTNVIGKPLLLQIRDSLRTFFVTGVTENVPKNSSIDFGIILPFSFYENNLARKQFSWISPQVITYVLLNPQGNALSVNEKIKDIVSKNVDGETLSKATGRKSTHAYALQKLEDIHFSNEINQRTTPTPKDASSRWYSYTLLGISTLLLFIACINFINISIAQSFKRSKEVGIRKVMSGTKKQLVTQFIGESFVPCALAFIIAFTLTTLFLPIFNQLVDKKIDLFNDILSPQVILVFVLLAIITTFLIGFYPSWIVSSYKTTEALQDKLKLTGRHYFARSLIVFQFSLTIIFIIGAFILQSQFNFLTTQNLGYNDKDLVRVELPPNNSQMAKQIRNELQSYPQIVSVSGSSGAFNSGYVDILQYKAKQINAFGSGVDESFLSTMEIKLKEGERLTPLINDGILINETLAKELGFSNPIGESIILTYGGQSVKIVGVMKDFNYWPLQTKVAPLFYFYQADNSNELWIKSAQGKTSETVPIVEKVYKQIAKGFPLTCQIQEDRNALSYKKENQWKEIIRYGAVIAILISCVGLFGFTALSIEQRTKEIGMRKILGASVSNIVTLFLKDVVILVFIAVIFAVPTGYVFANKWLQNFAYKINIEWWILFIPCLITLMFTSMIIIFQTFIRANGNLVETLRKE